jgi:hypothetical protein
MFKKISGVFGSFAEICSDSPYIEIRHLGVLREKCLVFGQNSLKRVLFKYKCPKIGQITPKKPKKRLF